MRIGFLGAGKMAEAIVSALIKAGVALPRDIVACEKLPERRADIRRRLKVAVTEGAADVVARADILFLAVKPQDLDALLGEISPVLAPRHLLISIAAGKTLTHLQRLAGKRVRLVRVMPNLAVMVGEGMSAFCLGRHARPSDRRTAAKLLGCCGQAVELKESQFDAVTALSGSGPAFFTFVLAALEEAAAGEGLNADAAHMLAVQTMLGTARYLRETGRNPSDFIQAVASPKGTTAAGLAVLERSDLRDVLAGTIRAAARRSAELSGG